MNTLRFYLSARLRLLRFTPDIVQLGGGCAGTLLSAECGSESIPQRYVSPTPRGLAGAGHSHRRAVRGESHPRPL